MKDAIIIGIGAVEQHGPASIFTDFVIVDTIAKAISEKTGAVYIPAIPYGYSEIFMDYKGTFSLEPETIIAVFTDLLRSAKRQGFKKVIILSSHDPNLPILKTACYRARNLGIQILLFDIWDFPGIKKVVESECWHACEDEISVMEYLGYKSSNNVKEFPEEMRMNYIKFPLEKNRRSESGVYGDLTKVSAKKGEKIFEIITESLMKIIKQEWFTV